jgi:DNA polymerase-1
MEVYFTEVLWRMERRGMALDLPYLKQKQKEIQEPINELERDISRLAGRPLNIDSPKQLAAYLFLDKDGLQLKTVKLTGTNQPSTDKEVLAVLEEAGIPIAKKIEEARGLKKVKSTYMDSSWLQSVWRPHWSLINQAPQLTELPSSIHG